MQANSHANFTAILQYIFFTGGKGGEGGAGGAALYFNVYGNLTPELLENLEDVLDIPAKELTDHQMNQINILINYALDEGLLAFDALAALEEEIAGMITEDITLDEYLALYFDGYQKLLKNCDIVFEDIRINEFADITVGTLSDKNGPKLASSMGEEAAEELAKGIVTELEPTGDNPRTGDDFSGIFVVLMLASALGMVALLTQRKRIA